MVTVNLASPLLPNSKEQALSYGLSEADIAAKVKRIENLFNLLKRNDLIDHYSATQLLAFQGQLERNAKQTSEISKVPNATSKNTSKAHQQLVATFKAPKAPRPRLPARSEDNAINQSKVNNVQFTDFASKEPQAYQVTMLPSGHFLFYRQVWQSGARIIQGGVLDPMLFLNDIITKRFERSSIANFAQLAAYHQDTLLIDTPKTSQGYYDKVLGTYRLSSPLDKIILIFSYQDLPKQKGRRFITFLSVMLLIAISLGLFAFYQLVVKQLQLMERQQGFISAVSHELKTPLTSIKMYSEVLQQGWLDDDKQSQYYQYINEETDRLTRLIDNVLQAANISRNQVNINLQPFPINELPDFIHAKTEALFKQSDFALNLHLDTSLDNRLLNIDKDALTQVIINLVDNAIKYSAKQEKRQVDISIIDCSSQEVAIKVRDYGIGIASQELSRIFDLFYRVGNELTRTSKGTGLGLTLVKELVKHMGGEISVVSCEIGTEFVVHLPSQPND